MQHVINARFSLSAIIESEDFYTFAFSDDVKHTIVNVNLNRNGVYEPEIGGLTYGFVDSDRAVTLKWFSDILNAKWIILEILHTK